jgi:formylglycine-generating enzyme required for sulfatase activity
MFATSSSGRSSSGAAYYGVMDMSGNVWERTVTTGNATGAAFTGTLGDGTLTVLGDADVATWPSVTTAVGLGLRGNGYFNTTANPSRTSDRTSATAATPIRSYTYGGRGVR